MPFPLSGLRSACRSFLIVPRTVFSGEAIHRGYAPERADRIFASVTCDEASRSAFFPQILSCRKSKATPEKAVQLRDFVIPEKNGIVVLCGYAVFLPI